MSLIAASYIIDEKKSKTITTTLARTDVALKPEIQIGKFKEEQVVISSDNWKEFSLHIRHFSDFFDGKLKQYSIQLVAEHHLTYIYTRNQFAKSYICISQIRRNSEEARFPASFYFSKSTWEKFVDVRPLVDNHLNFLTSAAPIVWSKIVPAVARSVFRLGGITKEACSHVCAKPGQFNMNEFYAEGFTGHENERVLNEILLFNSEMVWERIFEVEMAQA